MLAEGQQLLRPELDSLVDKRISAVARLAYDHNQFLHELFEAAGINPHTDIHGRSDLLKAYKRGVRTSGADVGKLYADYAPSQGLMEIWSSGSTGVPKRVLLSKDGLERFSRGIARSMASAGVTDGQKVLMFAAPHPYPTSIAGFLMSRLENPKLRVMAFRSPWIPKGASAQDRDKIAQSYIDLVYDYRPDMVGGGTFVVKEFARFMTKHGFDKGRAAVKSLMYGGDPTTLEDRRAIRDWWGADPFDMYASAEASVIAFECRSHTGLHPNERDVFITSVDPLTGDEVEPDSTGKDLCTNIFEDGESPATFFINYSHNDNVTMLSDACQCGSELKLMQHPSRDAKKVSLFDFDRKEETTTLGRALGKIRSTL